MKLIFMGTPDFAVPCLDALVAAGHTVSAVFTQPDKPVGRKREITPPPVKRRALELGIPVYQPSTLRDGTTRDIVDKAAADAAVVVAYGKLIPADMLCLPRLGFINVHGSILPKYRGAAPIQWAVVNGESVSGVTTMLLNEGMDTGDILETAETAIGPDETSESLYERLSVMGAGLICSTLEKLERGEIQPVPQNESESTQAPIITKEMALLNFNDTAEKAHNMIRGFYPWPIAYTLIDGRRLKVYSSNRTDITDAEPGRVYASDGRLIVGFAGGTALEFVEVQAEGSRRMSAADMLRGMPLSVGKKLGE